MIMYVGLQNRILTPQGANGLGIAPAVIALITAGVTAAAGITTAAINARTQKKNNQAAKELAQMQLDAQRQQSASTSAYWQNQMNQPTQQQQTQQQDNTLLYVALAALGLVLILKR